VPILAQSAAAIGRGSARGTPRRAGAARRLWIYRLGSDTTQCLTGSTSSNLVTTQPCNHGQNQVWQQGSGSAAFRELRNRKTSRSLNAQDAKQNGTTFSKLADQQFFTGASRMLWQVHVL
jgi:hypothetical protein